MTGIEPAMGCDAGLTLNGYWVGRPTLCVAYQEHRIDAYNNLGAMVVEGIGLHVEDIGLVSWTFRILAHEENQYSYIYETLGQFFV